MKTYVKLFEDFITNPAEEMSLKKQFITNPVTTNVPITRSVSQIVSDENGMHVQVGEPTEIAAVVVIEEPKDKKEKK